MIKQVSVSIRRQYAQYGKAIPTLKYISQATHLPQRKHLEGARSADEHEKKEENSDGLEKAVVKSLETEEKTISGRLSERLERMTEESIEQAGSRAGKIVEESGFSEELKKRLEAKIEGAKFKDENAAAFALVNMPSSAGKGSQAIASGQAWTGQESIGDAALRMLNDAHKPLRVPVKIPRPRAVVNTRMKKRGRMSVAERLAMAKDQTSAYTLTQSSQMSEREKEEYQRELRERYTAPARPMPATVQGLEHLANERIEDAIARGQFKNIPRGRGTNTEVDYNANSPFLDTTEYFMNKMIKKQEIVPPWIEKQQELVKSAQVFRSRLRSDWKRHAARSIASEGGKIDAQVQRAKAYAVAEATLNPTKPKIESVSGFDGEGKPTKITFVETTGIVAEDSGQEAQITITEDLATDMPSMLDDATATTQPSPSPSTSQIPENLPPASLFRDSNWEKIELPYHTLSISNLNTLTRSYNLQAPDLAKKPYFSLSRELRSCFADVAPRLPDEILERARAPRIKVEVIGHRAGGVLSRFGGEKVAVFEERKPQYGFKQFFQDLWRKEGET